MPDLVNCDVCGRRMVPSAARKVKGRVVCPPCLKLLKKQIKASKKKQKIEEKKRSRDEYRAARSAKSSAEVPAVEAKAEVEETEVGEGASPDDSRIVRVAIQRRIAETGRSAPVQNAMRDPDVAALVASAKALRRVLGLVGWATLVLGVCGLAAAVVAGLHVEPYFFLGAAPALAFVAAGAVLIVLRVFVLRLALLFARSVVANENVADSCAGGQQVYPPPGDA